MKKVFLAIAFLAISCLSFSKDKKSMEIDSDTAFDEIYLLKGSLKPFSRKANALLVIDYTNLTFVRHQKKEIEEIYGSVEDYYAKFSEKNYEDWISLKQNLYNVLLTSFNKKSLGLKLTNVEEEASLTYRMTVNQLDFGSVGENFIPTAKVKPWGGAVIDGYISIFDNTTGSELCRLALKQVMGQNAFTWGDEMRMKYLYSYNISQQLLKRVKKGRIEKGFIIEEEESKVPIKINSNHIQADATPIQQMAQTPVVRNVEPNQVIETQERIWRPKGYRGFIDIGPAYETNYGGVLASFNTTHGFQFNPHFFGGVGAGATYFQEIAGNDSDFYIPFYADFRYSILKSRITPFVDLKIGGAYSTNESEIQTYGSGFLGCHFSFTPHFGLNLSLGLEMLEYTDTKQHIQKQKTSNPKRPKYNVVTTEYSELLTGICFKVGLEF